MKLSLIFSSIAFGFSLSAQPSPVDRTPDLSKETTRALLENLSGLPPPIGGPIPEAEYLALRGPLTLRLSGGRVFEGTLSDIRDERIFLRMVQEGGEVVLSFPTSEIERIRFPGNELIQPTIDKIEEGNLTDALPYLESIIGARYALFPVTPPEELSLYRALPLAALAVNNPAQAIAYVRAIEPFLTLPEDQRELRDVELLSYYQLQLREEAEERARDWIAAEDSFGDSALGYFILSALEFERANYEEALYTALRPIVYSNALRKSYLAPCYSIAIASAHLLNDPIEKQKLFEEMNDRGLSWKPLLVFHSAERGLADLDLATPEGEPIPLFIQEGERETLIPEPASSPGEENSSLDPSGTIPL